MRGRIEAKKVIQLVQGHTANKKQSKDSNPEPTINLFISAVLTVTSKLVLAGITPSPLQK